MSPAVLTVAAADSAAAAARALANTGISGALVRDGGGALVGVVSQADLANRKLAGRRLGAVRRGGGARETQPLRSVQVLTFQTPVPMPAAQQCGKVGFADLHVKVNDGSAGGDDSDPSKPFRAAAGPTRAPPR